jgi:hypothetical protein
VKVLFKRVHLVTLLLKEYERSMKKYERNKKKFVRNIKEYEKKYFV